MPPRRGPSPPMTWKLKLPLSYPMKGYFLANGDFQVFSGQIWQMLTQRCFEKLFFKSYPINVFIDVRGFSFCRYGAHKHCETAIMYTRTCTSAQNVYHMTPTAGDFMPPRRFKRPLGGGQRLCVFLRGWEAGLGNWMHSDIGAAQSMSMSMQVHVHVHAIPCPCPCKSIPMYAKQ